MDLEDLLQPIAADAPCGQDMSYSTEFDQVAEMRREDDPTLEQGEWVTSLKVADWPGVARLCTRLLQTQTKDMRVANWLSEAWALIDGFEGLAQALVLQASLAERFWAGLYPLPEGNDQDERIGNIAWMLHRLVGLVDTLPFTRNRAGHGHGLIDWQQARAQASAPPPAYGQPEPAADAQKPTLELLQRWARETPADVWQSRLQALQHAEAALARWQVQVDAHLGDDGPGFVKAREKLASARHDIERLARDAGALSSGSAGDAQGHVAANGEDTQATQATPPSGQALAGGPPTSRAQALQRLREVADFFRRTEPHSPVAYLADKAVKWGDMPLHEWLRQVVKDQGSMAHLQELLGLDEPQA